MVAASSCVWQKSGARGWWIDGCSIELCMAEVWCTRMVDCCLQPQAVYGRSLVHADGGLMVAASSCVWQKSGARGWWIDGCSIELCMAKVWCTRMVDCCLQPQAVYGRSLVHPDGGLMVAASSCVWQKSGARRWWIVVCSLKLSMAEVWCTRMVDWWLQPRAVYGKSPVHADGGLMVAASSCVWQKSGARGWWIDGCSLELCMAKVWCTQMVDWWLQPQAVYGRSLVHADGWLMVAASSCVWQKSGARGWWIDGCSLELCMAKVWCTRMVDWWLQPRAVYGKSLVHADGGLMVAASSCVHQVMLYVVSSGVRNRNTQSYITWFFRNGISIRLHTCHLCFSSAGWYRHSGGWYSERPKQYGGTEEDERVFIKTSEISNKWNFLSNIQYGGHKDDARVVIEASEFSNKWNTSYWIFNMAASKQ